MKFIKRLKSFSFYLIFFFLILFHVAGASSEAQLKFKNFVGRGISDFVTRHLKPDVESVTSVFYPFGGADITFPFLIFPALENLVLVGLEPAGNVDHPESQTISKRGAQALDSLFRRGFLISADMSTLIRPETGMVPIILHQLKVMGATNFRQKNIQTPFKGVHIQCYLHGRNVSVAYYRVNLCDQSDMPAFADYIDKTHPFTGVILKSTSYCLHQKDFSKIRAFVLRTAHIIIQDDSGIPFKALQDHQFNVRLYGHYQKPYGKTFSIYDQPHLRHLYRTQEFFKVPFCFGYGCGRVPTHLIVAKKTSAALERN